MTADRDFLFWMCDRLVNVYNESPNVDFVQKLRTIAQFTHPSIDTPVMGHPRYFPICRPSFSGPAEIWDDKKKTFIFLPGLDWSQAQNVCAVMNAADKEE